MTLTSATPASPFPMRRLRVESLPRSLGYVGGTRPVGHEEGPELRFRSDDGGVARSARIGVKVPGRLTLVSAGFVPLT